MNAFKRLKSKIKGQYGVNSDRIAKALREKAIEQTKVRLALAELNIADLSEDELEIIVKEEEEKIKARFTWTLGAALMAYLGLS